MSNRNVVAWLIVALGLVAGVYFIFMRGARKSETESAEHYTSKLVPILTEANFDAQAVQHKGFMLVDFSAAWCGPCRMMIPIVQDFAEKYKGRVAVADVDLDAAPSMAKRFDVNGIPLLVILKDGAPISRHEGTMTAEELKAWVDGAMK